MHTARGRYCKLITDCFGYSGPPLRIPHSRQIAGRGGARYVEPTPSGFRQQQGDQCDEHSKNPAHCVERVDDAGDCQAESDRCAEKPKYD